MAPRMALTQPSLLLSNVSLAACRTLDKCLTRAALAGLAVPDPPDSQFLAAWHGPCNGGFPCWWYGMRASPPRRVPAQPARAGTPPRGGATAARPAPRSRRSACPRTPAACERRRQAGDPPRPRRPPPSLSCLLHGRQESARNGALPGPARSHADSTPSVMRGKGGTFFLVNPLRVSSRVPAGADGPEGLFDAEVGSELMCGPPAAVPCCCTCPEPWVRVFEFRF
jgi:hypothetical protein